MTYDKKGTLNEDKINTLLYKVIDYFGIDDLTIIYEDMVEDSVLDIKRNAIVINEKYKDNYIESAKCVVHEARHAFQFFYISLIDDERSKRWRECMGKYIRPSKDDVSGEYELQEVEIDAYAFTKYFLQLEGIDVIHKNPDYEEIIIAYLRHNKKFYEECCSTEKG